MTFNGFFDDVTGFEVLLTCSETATAKQANSSHTPENQTKAKPLSPSKPEISTQKCVTKPIRRQTNKPPILSKTGPEGPEIPTQNYSMKAIRRQTNHHSSPKPAPEEPHPQTDTHLTGGRANYNIYKCNKS